MSFTGTGGGAATPPSRLLALLQAINDASPQQAFGAEAQPGGRRGLIGSGYRAYMAQMGGPSDPSAAWGLDPLLQVASAQPSHNSIQLAQAAAAPRRPLDPRREEVFQRGPDGKLHAVPGWRTTGPFDVGQWARNIDWQGTAEDLAIIAAGALGGATLKGPLTALEKAALAGGLVGAGVETRRKLDEAVEGPEKRRPVR